MWTHLITMTTLFIFEAENCKNFEVVFLKTMFFKSSTSNVYISESFAFRRHGEVSIDPKFYLVLINPPEAIPLSDRLGHFSYQVFDPVCQWPHHGLTDRVFFIFFKSHFRPRRQWPYQGMSDRVFFWRQWPYHGLTDQSLVWSLTSYVEKVTEKNPVCETEVWSLANWVKNLNTGVRRPSKLSLIDKRRKAALKLLPSGSPQIQWCGMEGEEFSFFFY